MPGAAPSYSLESVPIACLRDVHTLRDGTIHMRDQLAAFLEAHPEPHSTSVRAEGKRLVHYLDGLLATIDGLSLPSLAELDALERGDPT